MKCKAYDCSGNDCGYCSHEESISLDEDGTCTQWNENKLNNNEEYCKDWLVD